MKQLLILTIAAVTCLAQTSINGSRTIQGAINYAASSAGTDTYAITLSPALLGYVTGACYTFTADVANVGTATLNINARGAKTITKAVGGVTTDLSDNDIRAGQVVNVCYDGTNMQMQSAAGNGLSANSGIRNFGASFDGGGSALTTRQSLPIVVPYACTISAWNILVAPSGTATVKLWKIASGTAIPTISNVINTSGIAISTGTAVRSTTVTDFTTTTVAANDIIIFSVTAVATATQLVVSIQCDAS